MDIKKAVITAASPSQRTLPLQTLVDRDGVTKSALRVIVEEVLAAGVEEICVVISAGDQPAYAAAAGDQAKRLRYVEQPAALGYGHAVACSRDFVDTSPFLLLVSDHLYISREERRCAEQLVEIARAECCAVSAVQATHESKLPYYGAVGGRLVPGLEKLYEVQAILEKPTPTEAEQRIFVPGLRSGHYLCFFGMHVLPAEVMDFLMEDVKRNAGRGSVQLTPALARLAASGRYLACEVLGRRYDIGARYGLLIAQMALALEGKDREEVLNGLIELLAQRAK